MLNSALLPSLASTLAGLLAASTATSSAPQARNKVAPPPGMVLIPGGTTKIGCTVKEIQELAVELDGFIGGIAGETPQHEVKVEDFFLMVNEVTNEQYAAYVRAAHARPPEHWAEKAIDAEQRAWLEAQGKRRQEAKEKGEPAPSGSDKFDRTAWWRANWEGKDWEIPAGKETLPVVFVDFADAQGYARWAGLRLMSEEEYQRAGRGKDARAYPWGDTFVAENALTTATRAEAPKPVGSFPAGATPEGVFELSGNVWEWTSSRYAAYPRWEIIKATSGKGKSARLLEGTVAWNENLRVAVGGGFESQELAARLTTRRKTDRDQTTASLGFRCAATPVPGSDICGTVMNDDVPIEKRPEDVQYDVTKVLAMDRWQSEAGTSKLANYAVITGYDYALYVPVVGMDITSALQLDEESVKNGPKAMGILSMTFDTIEPPLKKGTYFVSFLAKAKENAPPANNGIVLRQDKEGEQEVAPEPLVLPEGTDRSVDNFLFSTPDDQIVAAWPVGTMEFARPKEPSATPGEGTRTIMVPGKKPGEMVPSQVPCDQVLLNVNSWVKVANKGFNYTLALKLDKGALGSGWRR